MNIFVNDLSGRVPVFGYPMMSYSPIHNTSKGFKETFENYDLSEKIRSNWKKITKDIFEKNKSQFLIKELLEGMDENEQKE